MKPKEINLELWREGFLSTKEYNSPSDIFYAKLANRLYRMLLVKLKGCDNQILEQLDKLCIKLSQYLEDVISSLGIFQAFRELNKELTGRILPFYDVKIGDDYYDDDLNIEDIKLLVWSYLQYITDSGSDYEWAVVDPNDSLVTKIAQSVMDELINAFEKAPENTTIHKFLFPRKFEYDMWYSVKERLEWMCTSCYMSSLFQWKDMISRQIEKVKEYLSQSGPSDGFDDDKNLRRVALQELPFESTSMFLSLPNYRYYARMLKNKGCERFATLLDTIKVYDFTLLFVGSETPDGVVCYDRDGNEYRFKFKGTIDKDCFEDRANWGCLWLKFAYFDSLGQPLSDLSFSPDSNPYPVEQPQRRAKFFFETAKQMARKDPTVFGKNFDPVRELLNTRLYETIQDLPLTSQAWKSFMEIHFDKDMHPDEVKIKDLSFNRMVFMLKPGFNMDLLNNKKKPIFSFISEAGRVCVFGDGVRSINLPQNPVYSPRYKEEYSVEYYLLKKYNYEAANYLIRNHAYKVCSDSENNMKKVRRFICDNIQFLSRYFYQHQFTNFCNDIMTGLKEEPLMDYRQSFYLKLGASFTYEVLDQKEDGSDA